MRFAVPRPSGFPGKGGRVMIKFAVSMLFAGALLVSIAAAQTPPELQRSSKAEGSITPAPVILPLGVGTAFNASLDAPLDTRKTKAGDPIVAEAAEDVSYQRCMIFPKGTKIIGHVVRVNSGHGRTGSAIFVQFDKATLKDGQEVLLNAGIQALAVAAVAPVSGAATKVETLDTPVSPVDASTAGASESTDALVVSTIYQAPHGAKRTPLAGTSAPEGEFTSDGLFSSDSKGAFGRPDLKVYTPTSEGSHGTVLLSSRKNMHLDAGTHLLLVIQPPPATDSEVAGSPSTILDPQQ
jgi:hypothetical protein